MCCRSSVTGRLSISWGDIHLVKATHVVARSISDVPGDVSVKDTKTHQCRRLPAIEDQLDAAEARQRLGDAGEKRIGFEQAAEALKRDPRRYR